MSASPITGPQGSPAVCLKSFKRKEKHVIMIISCFEMKEKHLRSCVVVSQNSKQLLASCTSSDLYNLRWRGYRYTIARWLFKSIVVVIVLLRGRRLFICMRNNHISITKQLLHYMHYIISLIMLCIHSFSPKNDFNRFDPPHIRVDLSTVSLTKQS